MYSVQKIDFDLQHWSSTTLFCGCVFFFVSLSRVVFLLLEQVFTMPYIRKNDFQRKKLHYLENRKQTRKIQRKLKRGKKLSAYELEFLQRTHGGHNGNNNNTNTNKNSKHGKKSHTKQQGSKTMAKKGKRKSQLEMRVNSNRGNDTRKNNDYDINDPDAKLIASLEKKLGVTGNDKYWKKQEFTGDGVDCFFDLGYFSNDSDCDETDVALYKEYYKYQNTNNENEKKKNDTYDYRSTDNREKITHETEKEKREREQRRIALYGEGVFSSNRNNNRQNKNKNENAMKKHSAADSALVRAFLEDGDDEDDEDGDEKEEKKESNWSKKRDIEASNDEPPLKRQKLSQKQTNTKQVGKYIPPQLRKLKLTTMMMHSSANGNIDEMDSNKIELERQIRPKLNRLGLNNVIQTADSIVEYYKGSSNQFSNHEVTTVLCKCIANSIDTSEETIGTNNIILTFASLIVCIYYNCGLLITSNLIENLTNELKLQEKQDTRQSNFVSNMNRLFLFLYLFEIIPVKFVTQLLIDLMNNFIQVDDRPELFCQALQTPMKRLVFILFILAQCFFFWFWFFLYPCTKVLTFFFIICLYCLCDSMWTTNERN